MTTPRRSSPPLRSPEQHRGGPASGWLAGWRLALRMARREVRRDRGRSVFVWLMICLPVAAICTSQVILASQDLAPSESLELRLGEGSARLTWTGIRFEPSTDQNRHAVMPWDLRPDAEPALPLPGWGESLAEQRAAVAAWTGHPAFVLTVATASVESSGEIIEVLGIDQETAAVTGMARLTSGRFPEAADEVLVTPAWTSRGLPASGRFTVAGDDEVAETRRIVGTAEVRFDTVIGLVGVPDLRAPDRSFLLTGDAPVTWADAIRFAQYGFETTSRGIAADPPDDLRHLSGELRVAYGGIIGSGALLEVTLVVGPAFAIGAARQRRSLALAAANGAGVRQLRRLALGQALLLGSTASTAGTLLGVGVGVAAWPLLSSDPTNLHGPLEVPPFVAAVLVLGMLTAVVAALVPTRGLGRLDLVAALRGSARSLPPLRRARYWGLVLLVLGLAGTWAGAGLDTLSGQFSFAVWFGALVVTVAGVLLTLPSVLHVAGRLTGSASVVLRMSLRDLGRQRGRATATVAAILGGTVLLGVVWTTVASVNADIERKDIPQMPLGQGESWSNVRTMEGMKQAVASVDPALRIAVVAMVTGWSPDGPSGQPEATITALRPGCSADILIGGDIEERCRSLGSDERSLLAASADDLAWLFGLDVDQQAALRQGKILVDTSPPGHPMRVGRNELIDGRLRLGYYTFDGEQHHEHTFDVPAIGVDAELIDRGSSVALVGGLLTTETAARYSLALDETLRIVDPSGPISPELEDRLNAAIDDPNWGVRVERGYQGRTDPNVWMMTAFLALLAVIAAAMATILATAEQRPFLATFAAVGAGPRLSRRVATTQAALLALLGTTIGFGIGMLAGVPMALATTGSSQVVGPILVIPWQIAVVLVVGIPLVAALVAAVCVPVRPVLVRRAT
ncbi:MAG: hypothetical protein KIT69_07195 [Propionibacteriaceae bacterium]|nr:hypothetical protein [Propionibacteriaceae bacterium]